MKIKIAAFIGMIFTASTLYATPAIIDMPVDVSLTNGRFCISISNQCSDGWSFWQYRTGDGVTTFHSIGLGIGGADDTYAWDINLNQPSHDYDNGKPVYAVESGDIFTSNGWAIKTYNQILINHTNGADKWSSGYLHMKSLTKTSGHVNKGEIIGYISNTGTKLNHLHFVVYDTHNAGKSVNVQFSGKTATQDAVSVSDLWVKSPPIIANQTNGFDAQFKLSNSTSSTVTYSKVALAILNNDKSFNKDMNIFSNVSIAPGSTWQTNQVFTDSPTAGSYYAVAKVSKTGTDWIELSYTPFTVTAPTAR